MNFADMMDTFIQSAFFAAISGFFVYWLAIYISKHPSGKAKILKTAFMIMFAGGMLLYFYCHFRAVELAIAKPSNDKSIEWLKDGKASWIAIIPYIFTRSIMDVGFMFSGRGNSDVFYSLPESENQVFVVIFWSLHLIAFFTAMSALLIRFGDSLLRRIRTRQKADIDLVFGINSDTLSFGRNIADVKGRKLVYVDSIVGEDYEASIRELGGLIYSDTEALRASVLFLKNIRVEPHKTKLRLYALSGDYDMNLQYARRMSESLKKLGIRPEQTELVLLGTDELKGMFFQSSEERYGYGSVMSFDEYEMSARLLMHEYPICNAINFDENGRAAENVEVLIVGFGRMGHEVLRKVIANGQFEGSKFHYTIFDPKYRQRGGFIKSQYPLMFANYEYSFEPRDGRSSKIFDFLKENAPSLKYIVICIEDRDSARSMAVRMADRLKAMGYSLNVYTCDTKSVRCYSPSLQECRTVRIYDSDMLYSGELDRYAMELNHRYVKGASAAEDWKKCRYFDRMNSRAPVDYLIPLIRRITGSTGSLTHEQREILARNEHLRWCAFHYTLGFDVMEKEEFIQRVKARQEEIAKSGSSSIKITKDEERRLHVCLVDWDELDEVSRIENSITNGNKNYKDYDRDNVDMVMELIQPEEAGV